MRCISLSKRAKGVIGANEMEYGADFRICLMGYLFWTFRIYRSVGDVRRMSIARLKA